MYTFDDLKNKIDYIYDTFSVKAYLTEKIKKRVSYIYGKGDGFNLSPTKVYEDEKYIVFVEASEELCKTIMNEW
ncbi:hypothetical protein OSSY52_09830 [Tepiditoga spiralis]|uniref:Uncharacterized protein n=1 Tax=Tepiditoga spiralis TaxID=2108365 RepID=A0A7G1G9S6_9BACT|nr:hypothetical protein [Tepiditoga spiralis]BBE30842.1 hypothetical protein OSSY52_09830 [Tepiditoga spiralis]